MVPFLYTLPNALSAEVCEEFIQAFEESVCQTKGSSKNTQSEIIENDSIKKSTDIGFNLTDTCPPLFLESHLWVDKIEKLFGTNKCLNKGIKDYTKLHPEVDGYPPFSVHRFNIQRYYPNEGFYRWHFENGSDRSRVLVWMIYLNDVEDGGTEFKYQNHIEKAEQGKLVIWPADFTFIHRGQISQTKTKYILTGWFEINNY
jgi:hypothetical protein